MTDLPRFTYRGVDLSPGPYEKALSQALFGILSKGIHDAPGIAAALSETELRPEGGGAWTEASFTAELARISQYPASTGGPIGSHPPGVVPPGSDSIERTKPTFRDQRIHDQLVRGRVAPAAPEDGSIEARIEARANGGLRDRWWFVGPSTLVGDEPVALTRLGERLVAWRDADGRVNVVEDLCPHRGAPLSLATIVGGNLSCRYHGVQVAGDGTVVSVPAYPDCNFVGKKMVRSYPAVEHFQGIWVWFGEDAAAEPDPLRLPEELGSEAFTGFLISNTWYCNYQYAIDNVSDIMHPPYLHGDTLNFASGSKVDEVDAEDTGKGIAIKRRNDQESSLGIQEYIDDSWCYTRVKVFAPPANGPGGFIRIIATACPIDDQTCQFSAWRNREATGWQADLFRFMYYHQYDKFMWDIIDQDREMLEALPPWPPVEHLYQHDAGVLRVRRHIREAAEGQIRAHVGG